jgi:hypothetical protein
MSKIRFTLNILAIAVFSLTISSVAHAQATRTWVSGVGDDANPCSRTAPCKTFAGAISKTAAGGEISVLDPGGFGAVTITKAITLDGDGTLAGILAATVNGIIVNAGVNDVIVVRSLSINGTSGASIGLNGIRYLAGKHLHVEKCSIEGFSQVGIDVAIGVADVSETSVTDTTFNAINGTAIRQSITGGGTLGHAQITNVKINHVGTGIDIQAGNATVANSAISHCAADAIKATNASTVNIAGVVIDNNNGSGINASSNGSTVNFANCDIFNNNTGVSIVAGATGNRFGNSRVFGNGVNINNLGTLNNPANQ